MLATENGQSYNCSHKKKECGIGYLLTSEWDIISRFDNNFTKWMDAHPNREDRESAEKRRKEVINRRVEDLS